MEVTDLNRVDAKPSAGCVARPCPQHRGDEQDEHAGAAATPQEHEQRGVKAADEHGQNRSGTDSHPASIGSRSADGFLGCDDSAAPQYELAAVEDGRLPRRRSPDRLVGLNLPAA